MVPIAVLWTTALFLPATQFVYGYGAHPRAVQTTGLALAEFGWLGPLAANVAWYANIALLWIVARLIRGKLPGKRLPLVALAIALTALLPAFMFDFEQDGRFHPARIVGPALWFWIASFCIPAGPLMARWASNAARPHALPREGRLDRLEEE